MHTLHPRIAKYLVGPNSQGNFPELENVGCPALLRVSYNTGALQTKCREEGILICLTVTKVPFK